MGAGKAVFRGGLWAPGWGLSWGVGGKSVETQAPPLSPYGSVAALTIQPAPELVIGHLRAPVCSSHQRPVLFGHCVQMELQ